MKIQHQFLVLMSSIVLVPVAIFSIVIVTSSIYEEQSRKSSGYDAIASSFKNMMDPESIKILQKFLEKRPPDMDLVILDHDFTVRYTTLSDFPLNKHFNAQAIQDYISHNLNRYMFQFDRPVDSENSAYLMLRFRQKPFIPRPFFVAMDALTLILAFLLILATTVSIFIARSFASSISNLEKHTRYVAEGNLDFSIPVSGSEEVRSLGESIEKMRLSLKEESARRARLIMGISHDLKTPLALIKGYTEALSDGLVSSREEELKHLNLISSRTDQLTNMVDELIDYVKLDSGEWKLSVKPISLKEFLEEYSRLIATDARLYNKQLKSTVAIPKEITLAFDPKLVQRALENLIHNAFRYTGPAASIYLNAGIRGQGKDLEAYISVGDDGEGIKPEDLPHITEPFYRASNSRREPGTGLGLSIVKALIESHGWNLEIYSKPKDTIFTIHIPLSSEQDLV